MGVVIEEGQDLLPDGWLGQLRGNDLREVMVRHPVRLIEDIQLGLKIVIKGSDGDIRFGNDVPDGDVLVILFCQQSIGGIEQLVLCLLRLKLTFSLFRHGGSLLSRHAANCSILYRM